MVKNTIYLSLFLSFISFTLLAQGGKSLAEADRLFSVKSYDAALPKYLEAIQAGEKDPMVQYKAGVCYQKSPELSEQIKAIPYFEYALKNAQGLPNTLHYDLGVIYLKNEDIQKAIDSFTKFRE